MASNYSETQDRIVTLFKDALGYAYLVWQEKERSLPIEEEVLFTFLVNQQGYPEDLAKSAIDTFTQAATDLSKGIHKANEHVSKLLKHGVETEDGTVELVDWDKPISNDMSVRKDVKVKGQEVLDIVIYVNGIALGVIDVRNSLNSVDSGINQHLANQKSPFYTTMQLLLAGNDNQGLRYGKLASAKNKYKQWEQSTDQIFDHPLDKHLYQICLKEHFLGLIAQERVNVS